MSIVVITIPGPAEQQFVSELQAATGDAVSLVVVQKHRQPNLLIRFEHWNGLSLRAKFSHLYYSLRLRVQTSLRQQLTVFQATTASGYDETGWAAPTYYTYDVDSEAVYARVQRVEPTIMAVWGNERLASRLVSLPQHTLNLHFGISSAYRGAYANQRAVENDNWDTIGTTIHYMNGRADSGAALAMNRLRRHSNLYDAFATMHDEARAAYVDCVTALQHTQAVPTTTYDLAQSEHLRREDWTPARRFAVAKKLQRWQNQPGHTDATE